MYNDNSSPKLINCTFRENHTFVVCGGGMCNKNNSNPTLTNCAFYDNSICGMYNSNSSPALTNCTISGNSNSGISNYNSSPELLNCTISGNSGNGISNSGNSNPHVINCMIYGNSSRGIYNSNSSPTVTNCTISGNSNRGIDNHDGNPTVTNCILWCNTPEEISIFGTSDPDVTYSDIRGGWSGVGNICASPLFVNPANSDYHLTAWSPCIDAGDNNAPNLPGSDFEGDPRIYLDCRVDMGADEEIVFFWDCNGNTNPDSCDIRYGTSTDCNSNGIPDECDIAGCERIPSWCSDCNTNDIPDGCDIESDPNLDLNSNGVLDECEGGLVGGCYTSSENFGQGVLINVNLDVEGRLQRNEVQMTAPLPFLWVAASDNNTIVRIDTETGVVLGEYRSAPEDRWGNPSRTTVDLDGAMWAANRDDDSVIKIGLVWGGRRVNADGELDPGGQYLAPPFKCNTCEDRDGDGLIRTSAGLGNVLDWPTSGGGDGVDNADDECIIRYVHVAGTGTRTVAIDADNDVWVGGVGNNQHEKIDGFSGLPVPGTLIDDLYCGGYGGLLDSNEVLWSSGNSWSLLRYDTGAASGQCIYMDMNIYGLGFDPQTGHVWSTSGFNGDTVSEIDPNGAVLNTYQHHAPNNDAQGIAVDNNGNVWVAHSYDGTTVGHLIAEDGTFVGNVDLSDYGPSGPTGVAVDANGKVWVANRTGNSALRIDPEGGPVGGGDVPIGQVDLPPVELCGGAGPYNYSDMTGMVTLHTSGVGTWTVVHDGLTADTPWGVIAWNAEAGCLPDDPGLTVEVRAADSEVGLIWDADLPGPRPYQPVAASGEMLNDVNGRFIQIRVRFSSADAALCDLYVGACQCPGDVNGDGSINGLDIQCFMNCALGGDITNCTCSCADLNHDCIVDTGDLDLFIDRLLNWTGACAELLAEDCNENSKPDYLEYVNSSEPATDDCNGNTTLDECDIAAGTSQDCQPNGVPDECDIAAGTSPDGNSNGIPDECDMACRGDCNCDDVINWRDIDYFVAAMNDNVAAWEAMFAPGVPTCPFINNDVNVDGTVNWRDIDPFVEVMNTVCSLPPGAPSPRPPAASARPFREVAGGRPGSGSGSRPRIVPRGDGNTRCLRASFP